ncbi:DUF3293 domain-containing protein [Dyella subtropica]|uniref:DUF3293 domain-containing protein n=1 Tax=Dyella subtropica TaxID=2992127 RepID=UPI0022553231|nr:DUF3293 domain-containing protein [Dyella subtropica]
MDDTLLAAYRAAEYRVRLREGGWAVIRIDQPLPAALASLIGPRPWGFITAWNPFSQPRARELNRKTQRRLLTVLQGLPETRAIHAGLGVGADWREESLLVVGPDAATLDAVARTFEQNAYVYGHANDIAAALRHMDKPGSHCGQSQE